MRSCSSGSRRRILAAMCSMAWRSSPLRARRRGVSGPVSSTVISGVVSGGVGFLGEAAVVAPAGSLEVGCTWPLQARMLDLSFRPPVLLSTARKSAIFFAAWPGSFKGFVICTGRSLASVSLHKQNALQISYISRIYEFLALKTPRSQDLSLALDGSTCPCLAAGTFGGDLAHLTAEAGAVHDGLLGDTDKVADGPVESEAGGVVPGHVAGDGGHHEGHHLLLLGVDAGGRCVELHQELACHHDDGEDVVGVGGGEIGEPEPVGLAEFDD